MFITHEEARQLIQSRADQALHTGKREILDAHLKDCVECAKYASEIAEAEITLRTVMQKHWNTPPLPLQLDSIKAKVPSSRRTINLLPTRSILIGITVMMFAFAIWQFTTTDHKTANSIALNISPAPTPSLGLTSTQTDFKNCQMIQYQVSPNDTLASLAQKFSTSKETIMKLNDMHTEIIKPSTKLIIPLCDLTPTSTLHPPTFTITPALDPITYTPG